MDVPQIFACSVRLLKKVPPQGEALQPGVPSPLGPGVLEVRRNERRGAPTQQRAFFSSLSWVDELDGHVHFALKRLVDRAGVRGLLQLGPLLFGEALGHFDPGDESGDPPGGSADISFWTVIRKPVRSIFSRSATMPMIVAMQVPSAVATRSVGEKLSPFP